MQPDVPFRVGRSASATAGGDRGLGHGATRFRHLLSTLPTDYRLPAGSYRISRSHAARAGGWIVRCIAALVYWMVVAEEEIEASNRNKTLRVSIGFFVKTPIYEQLHIIGKFQLPEENHA